MSTATRRREPAGVPTGGQFAAGSTTEADVSLTGGDDMSLSASPYADLKGQDRVEAMKADLEEAVNDLVDSGELHRYLDAAAGNGMRRWSANNQILAGLQLWRHKVAAGEVDKDDTSAIWTTLEQADCRTFKQWTEQDRAPVKGSRALYILAPNTRKVTETDEATGKEDTKVITTGFRPMAVFDVSQTDGEPLPEHPSKAFTGQVAAGTVDGLRSRVAELGYSYSEKEILGTDPVGLKGTLAYVEPASKKVVVDSRLADPVKASALAHELGHIECGHVDSEPGEYQRHRGRMETEAEAFAYMMMRSRGADPQDCEAFSPGYIGGWSKGDTRTVQQALSAAGRAFTQSEEAIRWEEE